jgi:hypothetical protein
MSALQNVGLETVERPIYEGRSLTFTWAESGFSGHGVFHHDTYEIAPLGENGFRAFVENSDRSDLFRFEDGVLMHAAIVKYGSEPSIQPQLVFTVNLLFSIQIARLSYVSTLAKHDCIRRQFCCNGRHTWGV